MNNASPPPPTDPVALAKAQGEANVGAAVAQQGINSTNQITPQGSLTYQRIGTWEDGTPRFQSTTNLSPEQQAIYNQQTGNQFKLGDVGGQQLDKVSGILNTPFNFNSAISTQQADIARKLLDPTWNQRAGMLETKLANQGIPQGSEAFTNAQRDFGMQRDNAYLSALLGTRGQAASEAQAERNQPLNEITALMSGSQVSMPNWSQTPQASIGAVDIGGLTNTSWNQGFQNYGAQNAQDQALMGGLFGLAGAGVTGGATMLRPKLG